MILYGPIIGTSEPFAVGAEWPLLAVLVDANVHVRAGEVVHHRLFGSGAGSVAALGHLAAVEGGVCAVTLDDVGLTPCVFLLNGDLWPVGLDTSRISLARPGLRRLLPEQWSRTLHDLLLFDLEPVSLFAGNEPALFESGHVRGDLDGASAVHHQVGGSSVDLVFLGSACGGVLASVQATVLLHLLLLLSCSELVVANLPLVLVHLSLWRLHIKEGSDLLT